VKLSSEKKIQEFINLGLFSVSLIPVFMLFFVVYQRIGIPMALEWGEGAGINQIYRLLSGQQIYTAPTLDFMPLVYTPAYYWLASVIGKISSQVELSARLLSFLSSLGAAGIIAWLVNRDTKNHLGAWLSGALYLACYGLSDGFFDLIRVDSLYVFILLVALVVLQITSRPGGLILAGATIALGFFTKQSTLIVFIPLLVYLLIKDWKRMWLLFAVIAAGILLPFFLLNASSNGWFTYYILELPREHGYSLVSAINFWVGDLIGPLGIAVGFGLIFSTPFLMGCFFKRNTTNLQKSTESELEEQSGSTASSAWTYLLFAAGAIGAAWITRASNGGGANNAMSAYAAIAILFGLGFDRAITLIQDNEKPKDYYLLVMSGLVAIQFIGILYNPFSFIPTAGEIEANEMLIAYLENLDDTAWIPYRSHLPRLAGKPTMIHAVNLFELTGYFKGDVLVEGEKLVEELRNRICYQEFDLIVLDQPIPWVSDQLNITYEIDKRFSFLEDQRRSELLEWQGGYQAFYVPKDGADLNRCLVTISSEGSQ
jgi:4-amino-4-deoxy-L-arabinose transferase-like glycosyltransferase